MNYLLANPVAILAIGAVFMVAFILARRQGAPRPGALRLAAIAWAAWFAWEWAIRIFSPEANIRVDLLLVLPVVGLLTCAGLVLPFIPRRKNVGS